MIRRIRRLPSPALIVASLALLLAAAGGITYAASKINGHNIKKNSIPGNRIKKHSLRGNRLKKNTVTGRRIKESTLSTVPSARHATSADSAQPEAFAQVSGAGALNPANTKNVGSVVKVGTALYCFSGIPFTPRGGQVTVDFNNSATQAGQFGLGPTGGCPSGTQASAFTDRSGEGPSAAGFFVVFYH